MPSLTANTSRLIFPALLALGAAGCALVVYVGAQLGVLALAGVAFLLVCSFTHPLVPFSLYFGALFFADTKLPGIPISINQILAPMFFVCAAAYAMRGKSLPVKFGLLPLLSLTALYFAVNGILGEDLENGLIYARYVIIYLILAVCLAISLSSERTILALGWIIVVLTTGAALHGYSEAFEKNIFGSVANWGYQNRVSGTAPNPIVFAWNMVYAFPFAFLLFSEMRSKYTRFLAVAMGILILGAAVLTFNRQTYVVIALILGLCIFLYSYRNRAALVSLMTIAAIPAAFTVLPTVLKRLLTVTNIGKDYSFLERRDSYLIGIEMLKDSPVFGVGFGSYSKVWWDYLPEDYTTYFAQYRGGTNEKFMDMGMMAVLVETGVVGFLFFAAVLLYILTNTWKFRRKAIAAKDRFAQNLSSTVIVVLAIFVATSFIQDTFLYARVWIFYGLAMLLDVRQLPLKQPAPESAREPGSVGPDELPSPA